MIKIASFRNNKKEDWFSHKTRLAFVLGNIFKDGSRNSATFKMELFATIGNGRVYNQWTVIFACCCSNLTIFAGKIKIQWKWPCLEGNIRYNFLFGRNVFTFFQKHQLLSISLTFCFISKSSYKNENWYHCEFDLPGLEATMFWKILLIKCKKNTSEGFFKKIKDWNKFILMQLRF